MALVNCMKHTRGQGPIEKLGASNPLFVTCTPEGISVEKYGGPHAYEQLVVPRDLCDSLRKPGEEGYINLAIFQSNIIRQHDDGEYSGEESSGEEVEEL